MEKFLFCMLAFYMLSLNDNSFHSLGTYESLLQTLAFAFCFDFEWLAKVGSDLHGKATSTILSFKFQEVFLAKNY